MTRPTPTVSSRAAAPGRHPGASRQPAPTPASVWLTGQQVARVQREGRYLPDSVRHPGKMLPAIARHAIEAYTAPGDVVFDPMAGIGTSLLEAVHLGRDAAGTEYEPRWAHLAGANLRYATAHGATGHGHVWHADARHLPDELLEHHAGQVRLLLTSPPYGPSNHGQVTTHGRVGHTGKVAKRDYVYSRDRKNLAHRPTRELLGGFEDILRAALPLLAPDATVAVAARPWRRGGELVDLPTAVFDAARNVGLTPIERCVALLARHDDEDEEQDADHGDDCAGDAGGSPRLIAHGSFFQLKNIRDARAAGIPQSLVIHEDVCVAAWRQKHSGPSTPTKPQQERGAAATPLANRPHAPGTGHASAA